MPCYQRRTTTVELKNANVTVLTEALKADGWNVTEAGTHHVTAYKDEWTVKYRANTLALTHNTSTVTDAVVNGIKRAYTKQAFRVSAARQGFRVRTERGKLVAVRRRF